MNRIYIITFMFGPAFLYISPVRGIAITLINGTNFDVEVTKVITCATNRPWKLELRDFPGHQYTRDLFGVLSIKSGPLQLCRSHSGFPRVLSPGQSIEYELQSPSFNDPDAFTAYIEVVRNQMIVNGKTSDKVTATWLSTNNDPYPTKTMYIVGYPFANPSLAIVRFVQ